MISIIIPIWGDKYKEFLPKAIASIESQTYKDYEIIISDQATDLPTARNQGIKKAKGEYILCLDADDQLHPEFLEKTLKANDDIVGTWWKEYGDYESEIKTPELHPKLPHFLDYNRITCTALYKKEVWETVEGYDETMKDGLEDWDFWCQALKAGYTVTIVPEILFFYWKHGNTMIESNRQNHLKIYNYIKSKL
jgi:GT2 family glycosyltransferase